jgi:hypothetical protein
MRFFEPVQASDTDNEKLGCVMAWIRIEANKLEHTLARSGKRGWFSTKPQELPTPPSRLEAPRHSLKRLNLLASMLAMSILELYLAVPSKGMPLESSKKTSTD